MNEIEVTARRNTTTAAKVDAEATAGTAQYQPNNVNARTSASTGALRRKIKEFTGSHFRANAGHTANGPSHEISGAGTLVRLAVDGRCRKLRKGSQ